MNLSVALQEHWKLSGFLPNTYSISEICRGGFSGQAGYPVRVPGDVHTTLMEAGMIENPAYAYNDAKCGWVEKRVWIYRTVFDAPPSFLEQEHQELLFEGLDTYASVYLNGEKIGEYANMLIPHTADVTGLLLEYGNTLTVEFHILSEMADRALPEGFWINYSTERAYARKPGYSFGWDWTPRMATVGIWRPVFLNAWSGCKIQDVKLETESIDLISRTAKLKISVHIRDSRQPLSYQAVFRGQNGKCQTFTSTVPEFTVELADAEFWWTHDLGNPHLYSVTLEALGDSETLDSWQCRYGVRTIRLEETSPEGEPRFLFVLNGTPIFCRGANWVPVSCFLGSAEEETYRRLLYLAAEANMNMINLWGGGIYELPCFYELCDELGLLVWQYFMFACGEYPDFDEDFTREARREVEIAVRRLQNHCCIALWAGNVEGQMICEKIGLTREMYGTRFFNEDIPEILEALGETRPYLPTSPFGGPVANSPLAGDTHNWDVWFTDVPYTDYCKDNTTFASEFGIHACPARVTVEKYLRQENPDVNSHAFQYFNKDQDLGRMNFLMNRHIGRPGNLDEYIDYSQFVQAEGLKTGSEHYRRNFPHTGGALIWQLNDCCPVHSWSMIDCDLIPKASYYYAKRFFAPVAVSLEAVDGNTTDVWIVNNTSHRFESTLTAGLMDHFGNSYGVEKIPVCVEPDCSVKIKRLTAGGRFYPNIILPNRLRNFYAFARLDGQELSEKRFLGGEPLYFPPVTLELAGSEDGSRITVTAKGAAARFVKLDGDLEGLWFSDNYFDLDAGQSYTVACKVLSGAPLKKRFLYGKALNSKKIPIPAVS